LSAGVSDPRAFPRPASPVGENDGGSFGAGEGATMIAGIGKRRLLVAVIGTRRGRRLLVKW